MVTDKEMIVLLIVAFIAVVLFVIFREINCWYWKINKRIENQQKMIESQETQIGLLRKIIEELQKLQK